MIPRYSRPAMSRVWSEDYQFELWLKVEIAASQAWAEQGVIPQDEMEDIRKAMFSRELYDENFEQTPRVFLIDGERSLLYRGAIDNFKYPGDPEYLSYLEPAIVAPRGLKPRGSGRFAPRRICGNRYTVTETAASGKSPCVRHLLI